MARNNPRGFVPTRHLSGGQSFRTQRRSTRGSNLSEIRVGDPVYLDANGALQQAIVATVAGQLILGVVKAVYDANGRPRTHALPSSTNAIPVSTTGFAEVIEDPDVVYTVHCSASLAMPINVGRFINHLLVATGTAAGISRFALDGTDATATSVGHPWKILGVSTNELASPATGTTNNDIEVILTQSLWRNPTRRDVVAP